MDPYLVYYGVDVGGGEFEKVDGCGGEIRKG
jgi:hypothetical protein